MPELLYWSLTSWSLALRRLVRLIIVVTNRCVPHLYRRTLGPRPLCLRHTYDNSTNGMTFNYIATLLELQGEHPQPTTNIESTTADRKPSISYEGCAVHAPLNSVIRLRVTSDDVVKIFGHPPQEDFPEHMDHFEPNFRTNMHFVHFLPGDSPAYINYVMGDD